MTNLWAASLCTLSLTAAWAGCAGAPPIERESDEQETTPPPGAVVVDSKLDAGAARIDAARPPGGRSDASTGAGDAGFIEPGGASEGTAYDASAPAPPNDASVPQSSVPEPGTPDASAPPPPADSGPPPEPVDAGSPEVHDAGRTGCLAGTYKGSFQGEISALLGAIRIDVAGDITIEVELSGSGDRLTVRTGVLQGTDTSEDKNPLFARIGGVLNCATKKIENGTITDGTYNRVDPIWGGEPTTTTFSGTIAGIYSTSPPAAVGTWTVKNASGSRTSMGTWDATLQ
jgi:hypothetical protein